MYETGIRMKEKSETRARFKYQSKTTQTRPEVESSSMKLKKLEIKLLKSTILIGQLQDKLSNVQEELEQKSSSFQYIISALNGKLAETSHNNTMAKLALTNTRAKLRKTEALVRVMKKLIDKHGIHFMFNTKETQILSDIESQDINPSLNDSRQYYSPSASPRSRRLSMSTSPRPQKLTRIGSASQIQLAKIGGNDNEELSNVSTPTSERPSLSIRRSVSVDRLTTRKSFLFDVVSLNAGLVGQQASKESVLKTWKKEILPNFKKMRESKKLTKLIWQGVPKTVKGDVWAQLIDNTAMVTPKLYELINQRVNQMLINDSEDEMLVKNWNLIEADIHRTFSSFGDYPVDESLKAPLKNILLTYSFYRPDLGYVQGMSFIVAAFLLHMNQYSTFECFSSLLRNEMIFDFYNFEMSKVKVYWKVFEYLLQERLPKSLSHFNKIKLTPDFFFFEWVITLFSNAFPVDTFTRIWDLLFFYGSRILYSVGLTICKLLQHRYLGKDFEFTMKILKNPQDLIVQKILFQKLQEYHVSSDKFAKLREKAHKNLANL